MTITADPPKVGSYGPAVGWSDPESESPDAPSASEIQQTWSSVERPFLEHTIRVTLATLAVLLIALCLQLIVFGGLEHRVAQIREFDQFRNELAKGTGPTGPTTASGSPIAEGTAVALLQIPALGMKQVVDEGTSSGVLRSGPGHLPTTVFPGQAGVSAVYGRAEAYGGPFGRIGSLRKGDKIVVTTQVGATTYKVIDVRRAGVKLPTPLLSGQGRLTLVTSVEHWFVPSGLLYVDADAQQAPAGLPSVVTALPHADKALSTDTSNLWELVFLLQGLVIVVISGAWAWLRWGRAQTAIVWLPVTALMGYFIAGGVTRLLPNLM